MKATRLPSKIDEPHQVLLWSTDELVPMVAMICIGMVMEQLMVSIAIGLLLSNLLRRYKDSRPDGYLYHLLYWAGLLQDRGRIWINPFRRRWIA